MGFSIGNTPHFHGNRLHNRTDHRIYGQKQAQQDRQTQFQGGLENTSLMGIPYPPAIKKAIEVLQKRAQHIDDDIQEMIDELEDGDKK